MANRLLKIRTFITRHYIILTSLLYRVRTLTSHDTEESENSPESPHLGEINACANSVYQALLRFTRAPGTRLRRIVPSMEIRAHSGLFLYWYKGCTNARCILSRSYGQEEFKNVNPFSVQKAHKAVRAGQYLRSLQHRIVPSMEIHVHSRLFLYRYKGCTNARCILSRSYGHEEFKNVNPFSVQKAYKAVRAGKYLCSLQRRIVPSMEIRVHSRHFLYRYKGCTNARCILSRSYGHEEFKNVNPFSVQKAHKAVQAGQYLRLMHRRIVPSMEIRVHSRLFLARCKGCTNARCILSRICGHEEFKNVNPFSVQKAHKAVRPANISAPINVI